MPKARLFACLLLGCLLTTAGCRAVPSVAGTDTVRTGGTVVVGLREEPANLNPLLWRARGDIDVGSLIFSGLFHHDAAGEAVPDLAAEIPTAANGGITPDGAGMTVTYHLRADVLWHDGQPFTADDVVFTYEAIRSRGAEAPQSAAYAAVTAVQAVNPQTVTVRLSRQDVDVTVLFDRIIPAAQLRDSEDLSREPFNRRPVGTGPFSLAEWIPGDRIILQANPAYYGEGPYLDAIIFKLIPDAATLLNTLKTGQIDLFPRIEPGQMAGLAETYGIAFQPLPSRQLDALVFRAGVVSDLRVRQAILAAVDRAALVESVYGGYGRVADDFRAELRRPATEPDRPVRDLGRAGQLLTEAGWLPGEDGIRTRYGVKLRITCTLAAGDSVQEQAVAQLQAQLREAGIDFVPVAAADYPAIINSGAFETALVRYTLPAEFDPYSLWHSSRLPPAGQNYGRFQNYQTDQLLEQARALPDPAARRQAYAAAQAAVDALLPALPLVFPADIDAAAGRLQNYRPAYGDRLWNAAEWWVRID